MALALEVLNRDLAAELAEPLRMGIGLHLGPAIVGEMGYGRAVSLTAIGDTVNVASRLEALTKELGAQLVVSEEVRRAAEVELVGAERHALEVRGRRGEVAVWALARAAELPATSTEYSQRYWRRALMRMRHVNV
jgi:adenylate cyclase